MPQPSLKISSSSSAIHSWRHRILWIIIDRSHRNCCPYTPYNDHAVQIHASPKRLSHIKNCHHHLHHPPQSGRHTTTGRMTDTHVATNNFKRISYSCQKGSTPPCNQCPSCLELNLADDWLVTG